MKAWLKRVHDRALADTADTMTVTVRLIFDELEKGHTIDFSELGHVNPMQLAVALRATSTVRENAPELIVGWDEALELAKKTCIEDGINHADALYGMIER